MAANFLKEARSEKFKERKRKKRDKRLKKEQK